MKYCLSEGFASGRNVRSSTRGFSFSFSCCRTPCCHLFFSRGLFPFISPCPAFSVSPHLCLSPLSPTCFLVFSFHFSHSPAAPFLIHHFTAPAFPLRECARARVCERQGVGGRWIETMFVSGFCCLLNLICFIGILCVYFKRGNREEKENKQNNVECGLGRKAACWNRNVKFISALHY